MAALPIQDSDTAKCIKSCMSCAKACFEALHFLLASKVSTALQGRDIATLQMCADACNVSSRMMLLELPFHHQACELSFELSRACAEICERYDDPAMVRCAEACRHCSETCRGMAVMTVKMRGPQQDFSRATNASVRM
jgi:hypothetical protein